ncbi:MAG TPA: long-chain fatty acid--CoA ligase [Patescibacteria group bacterium]|nr:long-chain fatty acid--CoA ligase [Patescibacteria group bacterium]
MSLNLASLLRQSATRDPDRPALIADEVTLTHRQVHDAAQRFAGGLARLGVRRGQHVALLLPNTPQFTIAYFGALYLGATVVPINTQLTTDEILYHLDDSDAVVLVAWEECLGPARAAAARASSCSRVIVAQSGAADIVTPEGETSMTALIRGGAPMLDLPDTQPDDTAVIIYTSGTTGRPKGAELTHFNLFYNAECTARLHSFDVNTIALCGLPLFHSFGQTVTHNAVLMRGGAVVLMRRFAPGAALDLMQANAVTFFAGVPTMYFGLLHHADAGRYDLASLKGCKSGGAPMPVEVSHAFEQRFGIEIRESYGLSETSPVASCNHPGRPARPGSIGTPIEGVEFKLIDAAGVDIEEAGVAGEICIKGHNVMKGYYKRPEATAEAIRDGWLRTGDVARRDEDGYYFIVDRTKDMIIRGGYNVYPREVEEVLYAHPAVREAAVVGVAHESLGEEIKAVLAIKPEPSVTAEEIIAYCRERLAPYKCPRLVEFRQSLPKGPTGKILKRDLRG